MFACAPSTLLAQSHTHVTALRLPQPQAALPGSSLNALASNAAALNLVLGYHVVTSYLPVVAIPGTPIMTLANATFTIANGNITGPNNRVSLNVVRCNSETPLDV